MSRNCLKITALILSIVLLVSFLLTSCSGGKTLTIMGKKSDMEKSYMTAVFKLYEEKTGNKIKVVSIEDVEFEATASQNIANGDVPDILMHFNNSDLHRFDVEKNFYYLNDEKWVSELTDSAKAYCLDSQGNLIGFPFWESSVSGCYYNKTLLDSLGLEPATTQAEFDTLCQTLADMGQTPICWAQDGCTWMAQFGLDPVFADEPELLEKLNNNEIKYSDIPQVRNMAAWIEKAADNGWFGTNYLKTGWSDISPALSSGKAVMTFIWDTWFYTDFEKDGKYTVDDFAVMPVFFNTVEGGTYEGGNLNMMMLNKNGDKLELAREFLEFCAEPENYNAAFDGISTVKCFNRETANIQSKMVTDAAASIAERERVSTAASKIVGYSAEDVASALENLLRKKTDAAGCVKIMDSLRTEEAKKQGAEAFK